MAPRDLQVGFGAICSPIRLEGKGYRARKHLDLASAESLIDKLSAPSPRSFHIFQ
jgi:hypothetical protein